MRRNPTESTKDKILRTALSRLRTNGYAATTVEDLCAGAGVTKGAFFHHFDSKEDLALAAADYWSEVTGAAFAGAPYHKLADPLDRMLGYIDFRKALLTGELPEFTCLAGTMLQETYASNPAIREACARSITGHAATIERDIRAAIAKYGIKPAWTATSLALYTQAVLQGAFILAKATGSAKAATDAVDHLHRYVELLFNRAQQKEQAR
jgi:TetR/AcrR family transcriptional regulator, transcriptional repressor for nem operon